MKNWCGYLPQSNLTSLRYILYPDLRGQGDWRGTFAVPQEKCLQPTLVRSCNIVIALIHHRSYCIWVLPWIPAAVKQKVSQRGICLATVRNRTRLAFGWIQKGCFYVPKLPLSSIKGTQGAYIYRNIYAISEMWNKMKPMPVALVLNLLFILSVSPWLTKWPPSLSMS